MSASIAFRDYSPPGDISNPSRAFCRALGMTNAFSRRYNPRGLETPFYGPWGDLLSSIVEDQVRLLVFPQLTLYRRRDDAEPLNLNTSVATQAAPKGNTDEVIPDFGFVATFWDLRNADNPDANQPNSNPPNADQTDLPEDNLPDDNPPNPANVDHVANLLEWYLLKVSSSFVLGLAELKRPIPRNIKDPEIFLSELDSKLVYAVEAVEGQAALLFNSKVYSQLDEVLLVAVTGEWYQWKIAHRENYVLPKVLPRQWVKSFHMRALAAAVTKREEDERRAKEGDDDSLEGDDVERGEPDQLEGGGKDNGEGGAGGEDEDGADADSLLAMSIFKDIQQSEGNNSDDEDEETTGEADGHSDDEDEANKMKRGRPISRFEGISDDRLEQEVDDIESAWPSLSEDIMGWSRWIRLGTPASNQRLYLMHRFLKNQTLVAANANVPPPADDEDSDPEEDA